MKAYRGSRTVAPVIFSLSTRWKYLVKFNLRPIYFEGKNPRHPLWAPELIWTFGEERNFLSGQGFESWTAQSIGLVAIPTALPGLILRYCNYYL